MVSVNKELQDNINGIICDQYKEIANKSGGCYYNDALLIKDITDDNDSIRSIAIIHNYIVNELRKILIFTQERITFEIEQIFETRNINKVAENFLDR